MEKVMEKVRLGSVVEYKEIPRQLWPECLNPKSVSGVEPIPAQVTFVEVLDQWTGPFPHLEEVTEGVLTSSGWKGGMDRQGQTVHVAGESISPSSEYDSKIDIYCVQNNNNGGHVTYRFNSPDRYKDLYIYVGLTIAPIHSSWMPEKKLMMKVGKPLVKVLEATLQLIDNWLGRVGSLRPREHFGSLDEYLDFMGYHKTYVGGGGYAACARFLKAQGYAPLQKVEL